MTPKRQINNERIKGRGQNEKPNPRNGLTATNYTKKELANFFIFKAMCIKANKSCKRSNGELRIFLLFFTFPGLHPGLSSHTHMY